MAKKVLVAVFSASGVTKKVGEAIARIAGADFYEIKPAEPYTRADLNWMNKNSRSSVEMNDPSARPAIAGNTLDMAAYDTVIIGFPIIPFCTSGGSGVGRSDTALHKNVTGDVQWAKGSQINRPNEKAIRRWLEEVL